MVESRDSFYKDFHFKLGKIVVSYNLIESNLIGLICNLIDNDDRRIGSKMCSKLGAYQLLDLLKDLIKLKVNDDNILEKFDTLYKHIREVIKIRNDFIHSIYINSENNELILNEEIAKILQIKIREFCTAKKEINSSHILGLEGMENFINILKDVFEETNEFFDKLSEVIQLRQIKLTIV